MSLSSFIEHEVDQLVQAFEKFKVKLDGLKTKNELSGLKSTTKDALESAAKGIGASIDDLKTAITKARKDQSESVSDKSSS